MEEVEESTHRPGGQTVAAPPLMLDTQRRHCPLWDDYSPG